MRPVGDSCSQPVDARIISATSQDLKKMSEAGQLRKELYFRMAVFPIYLTPLRERRYIDHVLHPAMSLPAIVNADVFQLPAKSSLMSLTISSFSSPSTLTASSSMVRQLGQATARMSAPAARAWRARMRAGLFSLPPRRSV